MNSGKEELRILRNAMQNWKGQKTNQANGKNADESRGGPSNRIINFLSKNKASADRQDKE